MLECMVDDSPSESVRRVCISVAEDMPAWRRNLVEDLTEKVGALRVASAHDVSARDGDILIAATDTRLEVRVIHGDARLISGHGVSSEPDRLDTKSGPGRSLKQPLLKAVGIRKGDPYRPSILDTTAGLGEDAWLLASVGCRVLACERHPIIYALLADALTRARDRSPEVAERITLRCCDSRDQLKTLAQVLDTDRPEVITIDPMFPSGRKTAERKALAVLRLLAGDDPDADILLNAACKVALKRVVVKRPSKAEPLAGMPPAVSHPGRGFRFDVYPTSR
ncbi:MAG: hypothetical protein Kow00105_14830 [Phycisphaeraceae bacterium]